MDANPLSRPIYVMAKPAGAACNLRCEYCYYLEKSSFAGTTMMDDATLETFVRSYIESQTSEHVLFTWHGGEPLLRPISFYERALRLQEKYANGRAIDNCIQTNGTLITAEWARFFRNNKWLVGVSIDGPQEFHDEFRRAVGGGPTWHDVMRGIGILNRYGAEWNAMSVINDYNADYPLDFYNFFRNNGCRYLQFTPVVEREFRKSESPTERHLASAHDTGCLVTDYSVAPDQWGQFLCDVFDEWVRHDVGEIFVQTFDATLANWAGVVPGVCSLSTMCGHSVALEANGDLYSCDHFVFPEYKLGNIEEKSIVEMMHSEQQSLFARRKLGGLPSQCVQCRWIFLCNGECPRNRFERTIEGERGLNYLCKGYQQFFAHSASRFAWMKQRLDMGLAPADIVDAIAKGEI